MPGMTDATPLPELTPAAGAEPAADPQTFFAVQGELPKLPVPSNTVSPLRKLGTSPFPKSGFPTLGFLETVYEHIQDRARHRLGHEAQAAVVGDDELPAK